MKRKIEARKDESNRIIVSLHSLDTDVFSTVLSVLKENNWHYIFGRKEWVSPGFEEDAYVLERIMAIANKQDFNIKEELPSKRETDMFYCWKGTIADLYRLKKEQWIEIMYSNYKNTFASRMDGDDPRCVWGDCYDSMKNDLLRIDRDYPGFYIIFEYSIPETFDSRPDVLLVSKNYVVIVEYKNHAKIELAEEEATIQSDNYYRELKNCHVESRESTFLSYVYYGQSDDVCYESKGINYCSRGYMYQSLSTILGKTPIIPCDLDRWINSLTEPRPEIINGAIDIFNGKNLKDVKLIRSTQIPAAIKKISSMIEYAKKNKKHLLVMVSGVPGAGKTYLGLQLVYDNAISGGGGQKAVYLSGNGPLVDVLQTKLDNTELVKPVKVIRHEYLEHSSRFRFYNNVVVFDEGQRAWDKNKLKKYNTSEPKVLIKMLSEKTDWCVFIVLVGEGQEIHTGENGGITQWYEAITYSKEKMGTEWEVCCPERLAKFFPTGKKIRDYLYLEITIRPIFDIFKNKNNAYSDSFVAALMSGDIQKARELMQELQKCRYHLYVTRNLDTAKNIVIEKCKKDSGKTYGFITSSKKGNSNSKLPFLMNVMETSNRKRKITDPTYGQWYDPLSDKSCRKLQSGVSEFGCQGLELDWPILYWRDDMIWTGDEWELYSKIAAKDADINVFRINSYRVLLTRGRYGMVICIPNLPSLDYTYRLFQEIGAETV